MNGKFEEISAKDNNIRVTNSHLFSQVNVKFYIFSPLSSQALSKPFRISGLL